MTDMVPVPICGREDWTILMPAERAARVQWPWHEWNRFHSMFHNLRPGDVLFDIGAEQGDQSALYAKWVQAPEWDDIIIDRVWSGEVEPDELKEGGIVLVEPNEKAWPAIKAVWEANELRDPLAIAVAFAGDETIDSYAGKPWPLCADGEIDYPIGTAELGPDDSVTRIDSIVEQIGMVPDAVTIDVEGAELEALWGAQELLEDDKPLVWVSIHWQFLADRGQSRDDVVRYMASFGYCHEHLGQDHEGHSLFWHPEGRRPVLPYGGVAGS